MCVEKNKKYGNAAEKAAQIMRIMIPDGVPPEKYGEILIFARSLDKWSRIFTDPDAYNEDPYADLVGYSLLNAASKRMQLTYGEGDSSQETPKPAASPRRNEPGRYELHPTES